MSVDSDALRGIVVGAVGVGESHKIVRVLTAERGRVALMALGARSSSKRFPGLLEAGTTLDLYLGRGRGSLPLLKAADRVSGPKASRRDLDRLAHLTYGCELCAALAPEEAPAPRLYGLLGHWIDCLEGEHLPLPSARLALEGKALTFAGLAPALVTCAACGEVLDDPVTCDVHGAGGRHGRCGGGLACRAVDLARLDTLRRTPLRDVLAAGDPFDGGALRWALARMVEAHVGRELRSRALLVDLAGPRG